MTEQENPNLYSPLALAFLGDAVYELCAPDYRRATGVEALFGYLFLKGEHQRLKQLFLQMNHSAE